MATDESNQDDPIWKSSDSDGQNDDDVKKLVQFCESLCPQSITTNFNCTEDGMIDDDRWNEYQRQIWTDGFMRATQ